jgi:hypothetical protein
MEVVRADGGRVRWCSSDRKFHDVRDMEDGKFSKVKKPNGTDEAVDGEYTSSEPNMMYLEAQGMVLAEQTAHGAVQHTMCKVKKGGRGLHLDWQLPCYQALSITIRVPPEGIASMQLQCETWTAEHVLAA